MKEMPFPVRIPQKEKMSNDRKDKLDRDDYGHPSDMVGMTMQINVNSTVLNGRTYSLPRIGEVFTLKLQFYTISFISLLHTKRYYILIQHS